MDSEALENNVHEKLCELFKLSFGGKYVNHRTITHFSDSFLRSMKTIDVNLHLQINKQLDITIGAYHSWVQEVLGPHFYVTEVTVSELNDKFSFIGCSIIVQGSSNEEAVAIVTDRLEEIRRQKYDQAFNNEMDTILDENRKIR